MNQDASFPPRPDLHNRTGDRRNTLRPSLLGFLEEGRIIISGIAKAVLNSQASRTLIRCVATKIRLNSEEGEPQSTGSPDGRGELPAHCLQRLGAYDRENGLFDGFQPWEKDPEKSWKTNPPTSETTA